MRRITTVRSTTDRICDGGPLRLQHYEKNLLRKSSPRPGVAQRVPGRFPDFMTKAQDCGKIVSLTHRPPLSPGNIPGAHFC